jgi:hypothetical protein
LHNGTGTKDVLSNYPKIHPKAKSKIKDITEHQTQVLVPLSILGLSALVIEFREESLKKM